MSKVVLITLFAIIALAQARYFLPKFIATSDEVQGLGITGGKAELTAYFNALWGSFNLNQSAAANCYNNITAPVYWQVQTLIYQMNGALVQGNHTAFNSYAQQLRALNSTISPAIQCERNTTDYFNLLNAAGANTTNMTHFRLLESLYDQGYFPDWYVAYTPVYNLLNTGKWAQGGAAYGPLMKIVYSNSSHSNVWFEAFKAYQNGIFYHFNLTSPYQIASCWNDTTGRYATEFYYLWSQTVANSSNTTSAAASDKFFNTTGRQLLQQLQPVRTCLESNPDQARLNKKVGQDVLSRQFDQAAHNWIQGHQAHFFYLFSDIYRQFSNYRPQDAGVIYGDFYQIVAQSMH